MPRKRKAARQYRADAPMRERIREMFANSFCWFDKRPGSNPHDRVATLSSSERKIFDELYGERYSRVPKPPNRKAAPAAAPEPGNVVEFHREEKKHE